MSIVHVRPAILSDWSFIRATLKPTIKGFLREGLRERWDTVGDMVLEALRDQIVWHVACAPDDLSTLLGWIARSTEDNLELMCYVSYRFRKNGISTLLRAKSEIDK